MLEAFMETHGHLSATVIRADGSHRDIVVSKKILDRKVLSQRLMSSLPFVSRLYYKLRGSKLIPAGLTLAAFAHYLKHHDASLMALVTTAGVNYMAADFLSSSVNHIAAFNYHDSGTGTTAETIANTALQTQAGPATRATGTQSNPTSGKYQSQGTITYTSSLAITEWGLFNQAAQGGTLWDHRTFSAINVNANDSIQFTYALTVNAGGS